MLSATTVFPPPPKKPTLATELDKTAKLLFHLSKGIKLLEHVFWRISAQTKLGVEYMCGDFLRPKRRT